MGLSQILLVLGRRWYIVALGLLLTLGLAYGALVITPPVYEARGTILLMPSKDQLSTGGRNPFLQLGALDGPAGIVIARLSGDEAHNLVEAQAPDAEFGVEPDPNMRGPGIQATVSDTTPAKTLQTLDLVLTMVTDTLAQVQAEQGVPKSAIVGSMRLVVDTEAERVTTATVRSVVAALAVGLLVTAALAFAVDALVQRRRRSSSRQRTGATKPAGRPAEPAGTSTPAEPSELRVARRQRRPVVRKSAAPPGTDATGEQRTTTPTAQDEPALSSTLSTGVDQTGGEGTREDEGWPEDASDAAFALRRPH